MWIEFLAFQTGERKHFNVTVIDKANWTKYGSDRRYRILDSWSGKWKDLWERQTVWFQYIAGKSRVDEVVDNTRAEFWRQFQNLVAIEIRWHFQLLY